MAESAVKSAAEWLGKLVVEKVKYLQGVRDKVEELHEELAWMQCFMSDADARQYKDPLIRMWVSHIKELAYDAEDVTEKFMLRVYNKDKHRSLKWFFCLARDATALREIGSEIDSLTAKICKLSSRSVPDVLEAVSAISAEKTPGQDGFTSKFFTASWGIVGRDISEAVLGFFHDCQLPKAVNHFLLFYCLQNYLQDDLILILKMRWIASPCHQQNQICFSGSGNRLKAEVFSCGLWVWARHRLRQGRQPSNGAEEATMAERALVEAHLYFPTSETANYRPVAWFGRQALSVSVDRKVK
ncbi:hypothetical protein Dimus_008754 [Dionaea muscipula]